MSKLDVGCAFCGKEIDYRYMVYDEIWNKTGLPKLDEKVFIELHIECLEEMIGRKLTKKDFTICPLNAIMGFI